MLARPELASLRAVRNDDIVVLSFAFTASSPLLVSGLEMLADQLDGRD